jgi:hypothetical protein
VALGLAAATEHEPTKREPEPEGAQCERAHGDGLAPAREPLPATERRLLFHRQGLATAPFAQRATGPHTQVEVVEELGALVRHRKSVYSLPRL